MQFPLSRFCALLKALRGKRVLCLTHKSADVDAIAAAAALQDSFKSLKITVGIPSEMNLEAKSLCDSLKIRHEINPIPQDFDAVILVDFNESQMLGSLEPELEKFKGQTFIIDHHSDSKDSLAPKANSLLVPNAFSACQIVFLLLEACKLKPSKHCAELLSAGIISDSNNLQVADSESLSILARLLSACGKSVQEITGLFEGVQDISGKIACLKAAERLELYRISDFLIATSSVSHFASLSADKLVMLGADLAFVGFSGDKESRINARASTGFLKATGFDLSRLFLSIEKKFDGHGGGHAGAAGFNSPHANHIEILSACLSGCEDFLYSNGIAGKLKKIVP